MLTQSAISLVQLHGTKCQLCPPLSLAGKIQAYHPSSNLQITFHNVEGLHAII